MLAAIALPMLVGCKDDSQDNTDKNKSEENVTAVAGITLSASSLSLAVGDTSALTFTISPSDATNKNVTWSSIAPNVASVANGMVTAVSAGNATIIVSTADGGKTAACDVNVSEIVVVSEHGSDTIKLVNVDGGTFTMGCDGARDGDDAGECFDKEKPSHNVTLSTYKIGKYEVTQKLWRVVMGSLPSEQGNNFPVHDVSWDDVQEFLEKLKELTGKHFRLPTEAEWEYAARGGKDSKGYKYSGSNNIVDVAWYGSTLGPNRIVGTKAANELGIYDMSGNVWEWCSDYWGDYSAETQTNPTGPVSGSSRVYRGGSYNYAASACRISVRTTTYPDQRINFIGFRVVLPVE
jgi:formylglycine-generating enzyme required for sulfatase activity